MENGKGEGETRRGPKWRALLFKHLTRKGGKIFINMEGMLGGDLRPNKEKNEKKNSRQQREKRALTRFS